jgi:hypothetical protein
MTIFSTARSYPLSNATELLVLASADALCDVLEGYEQYSEGGWDGDDAQPITSETLAQAREFIRRLPPGTPLPYVAPAIDGTIGLEWRCESTIKKLFVDIGPGSVASAYWRLNNGSRNEIAPSSPGVLVHSLRDVFSKMDCSPL